MRWQRMCCLLLTIVAPISLHAITLSQPLKSYSATYESNYQGRNVKGTRSLMQKDGKWILRTKLRKYVVSVVEESEVTVDGLELTPLKYEYRRSVMGVKKRQKLEYDYANNIVHFNDGKDKGEYPLIEGSVDKASQQFLIEEMLRQGQTTFSTNLAKRNRNKINNYRVLGEEILELPIGVTKTIKVEIVPDPTNKRYTVMWFDPDRNYLLVQLDQTDKNGKTYTMKLSDVSFLN